MKNRSIYSWLLFLSFIFFSHTGWSSSLAVPQLSSNIVSADFNGDGRDDIAVFNIGTPAGLSIYLNNGQGSFTQSQNFSLSFNGNLFVKAQVGDFNGDGHPDIIVSNSRGKQLIIFSNNGNGSFSEQSPFSTIEQPSCFCTGNFKGNGKRDVAVVNAADSILALYWGNGNYSFADGTAYTTAQAPTFVVAGDLRKTGYDDIVVAYGFSNQIQVFFNSADGNGHFTASGTYSVGDFPIAMAIGDLNNDGYPDLAVANMKGNIVSVLLNQGGSHPGFFNAAVSYATQYAPLSIALLGSPGSYDIVTANEASSSVSRFNNLGNGTFTTAINSPATNAPISIAVGQTDYFVLNFAGGNVNINPVATNIATTTALTQSSVSSQYGDPVTFTATITPATSSPNTPSGTVSFYNGGTLLSSIPVSNNAAILTISTLPGGNNIITAVYSGDSNFASSTSAAVNHLVNKEASPITLLSSSNPSLLTEAVTFTATISTSGGNAPTGSISFAIDGTVYATVEVIGNQAVWTSFFLTEGKHTIVATYSGDHNYATASATIIQEVVSLILPPTCASGVQKLKYFPKKHPKYVNILSWKAPSVGPRPVKYCVYRNARLNRLVGCVKADNCNDQFTYHLEDKKVKKGEMTTYYIVSVDEFGLKSNPTIVVVVPK